MKQKLLLFAILAALTLSGCGSKDEPSAEKPDANQNTSENVEMSDQVKELGFHTDLKVGDTVRIKQVEFKGSNLEIDFTLEKVELKDDEFLMYIKLTNLGDDALLKTLLGGKSETFKVMEPHTKDSGSYLVSYDAEFSDDKTQQLITNPIQNAYTTEVAKDETVHFIMSANADLGSDPELGYLLTTLNSIGTFEEDGSVKVPKSISITGIIYTIEAKDITKI